jgi:putative transposase
MNLPADVYTRSPRVYRGLAELTYPFHDQTILVTRCGRIGFKGRKVNLSHVFAGQLIVRRDLDRHDGSLSARRGGVRA